MQNSRSTDDGVRPLPPRMLEVFAVPGGFEVIDQATGKIVATGDSDPLALVVQAGLAAGLAWQRLVFNDADEWVPPGRPLIRVEAAGAAGRPPRLNPLENRELARRRRAARDGRGGEFTLPVAVTSRHVDSEGYQPPTWKPTKFTAEQEALYAKIYGSYWRSEKMEKDIYEKYLVKEAANPRHWRDELDRRISEARVAAAAHRASGRGARSAATVIAFRTPGASDE